jgi:uncharacterized protein YbjT (DUF2867 family)
VRIAVLGATGVSGRFVVMEASRRGHDVVAIARNPPANPPAGVSAASADLQTGQGLAAALNDVDTVIDCSNIVTNSGAKATRFFTQAHRNLLAARRRTTPAHWVLLSILGAHAVPMPYYKAKVDQERLWSAESGVSLVRSTQFHQFADQILRRMGLGPGAVVPTMRVQPIAAESTASVLVSVAEADPSGTTHEIAGPREENLVDMARRLIDTGRSTRRFVLPMPIPGAAGRAIKDGALLGPRASTHGPSFDDWLALSPH